MFIAAALLSISTIMAQEWTMLNPNPTFNAMHAVSFPSADTGFVVGNNSMVLRTFDGGQTWQELEFPVEGVQIRFVDFRDNNHGIIVAWSHILTTSDAGESWNYTHKQLNGYYVNAHLIDEELGWVVGSKSILMKTNDGGLSWQEMPATGIYGVTIEFASPEVGYIAGHITSSGTIPRLLKTTDGGDSWEFLTVPDEVKSIAYMDVIDEDQIWVAAKSHMVNYDSTHVVFKAYRSMDGGQSWQDFEVGRSDGSNVRRIQFNDASNGMLMSYSSIYFTTDSGTSWESSPIQMFPGGAYTDFSWDGDDFIVASGFGPSLVKSTDGGNNWTNMIQGWTDSWRSIYFLNEDIGFVGSLLHWGVGLLRTSNGGQNWEPVHFDSLFSGSYFYSIAFADQLRGWAPSTNSKIYHTTDGGINWNLTNTGFPYTFHKVNALPDGTIYMISSDMKMIKSTDWGVTWMEMSPVAGEGLTFNGMFHFIDASTGFLTARNPQNQTMLFKTSDGGLGWQQLNYNSSNRVLSLSFFDENNGMISVQGMGVMHTDDGGDSWSEAEKIAGYDINHLKMYSQTEAVAVYDDAFVAVTEDGGETWSVRLQQSSVNPSTPCFFFLDGSKGWIAAWNGLIMRYDDQFLSSPEIGFAENNQFFYPNPASDVIHLKIDNHQGLRIYNTLGDLVFEQNAFISEKLKIDFLPVGMYIVEVQSEGKRLNAKLLKY